MASCPFCLGDIPAGARKCQHCGEWVEPGHEASTRQTRAAQGLIGELFSDSDVGNNLGRSVNSYVNFKLVSGIIGTVMAVIMLIFILSMMSSAGH